MIGRTKGIKCCCLVVRFAAILVAWSAVAAQETARSPEVPAAAARYVDGSFGFALTPPIRCDVFREKRFIGTDDVEVVRFVNAEAMWSLSVRQSKPQRALDPETLGAMVAQELAGTCQDIVVVRADGSQVGSREMVRCAVTMTARGIPMLRQQAMIRVKPTEYFAVILASPQSDEKNAALAFDKAVASFEVLRSEAQENHLREALVRGSSLLQLARSGSLDLQGKDPREVFLRYVEGGQENGFMQIRMVPGTVDRREGLTVFKWFWYFPQDESITLMQQDMFVTPNLSFEKWESRRITISPPPRGGGQRQISVETENGIRQGDKLLVAYAGKSTGSQITEKELDVDRTYASAAWDVLLPTLVDLSKQEVYAFSWYDSSRRGLALQTFRVVGEKGSVGGAPLTVIEQSEGMVPPFHELSVDRSGLLARVVMNVGDKQIEMPGTTRQDVERKYGARVREVEALLPRPQPTTAPVLQKAADERARPKRK